MIFSSIAALTMGSALAAVPKDKTVPSIAPKSMTCVAVTQESMAGFTPIFISNLGNGKSMIVAGNPDKRVRIIVGNEKELCLMYEGTDTRILVNTKKNPVATSEIKCI